jgi:hypothetical protein
MLHPVFVLCRRFRRPAVWPAASTPAAAFSADPPHQVGPLAILLLQAVFQIRIQSGQWIRIQERKNDPQKKEKVKLFHVLKCWMFSFDI